jgi:long-chain acyl-CoA synthetase
MTIVEYINKIVQQMPDKLALIHEEERITYAELYRRMRNRESLPVPLLGDSWDSDFFLKTTGTTGNQKTVIVSQRAVIANSVNLIDRLGFSNQTVFVVTGALDHLGNWSKVFPVWMLGGTVIVLDNMKYIDALFDAFDIGLRLSDNAKLATFLVPASIRILLQFSADRIASYSNQIDFIETGAAPISHADMLHLCSLLPHTRLYNTYASTETGIIASYNFNDGRTLASCCGKPMKNATIFITSDGRIACQGPMLMSGYQGNPELTQKVLKPDENGIATLYTSDNGYIDKYGFLHISGRSDDIINVGGLKVAPSEIENAAMEFDGVDDCVCVPVAHPILGQVPKLLVVTKKNLDKRQLACFLAQRLDKFKIPLDYKVVDHVERNKMER